MTDNFDLLGPLPTGTTVLEASAGTGKTHAIATLAVRYLAAGVPIESMMMITFGRAATVELRERVRERLTYAAHAAANGDAHDPLVAHLLDADPAEVERRCSRLATAVADFDAATIATTHGFCQQMLAGLGIAADVDHDVRFAEDTADVVTEVVQDLYVRAYGAVDSAAPAFTLGKAIEIASDAVCDHSSRLEPRDAAPDSVADLRRRIAESARSGVQDRKRLKRLMDYDDLLVHLRDALVDSATGRDAQDRIRSRYDVVLVDEFQDTDPVQWEILATTFHGHRTLVLIGDPKQAIYAFRGADVTTYLDAIGDADSQSTLGTNWRSDAPLVRALGSVMGETSLGDDRIVVHDVDAAHQGQSIAGERATPLRFRLVTRDVLEAARNGLIPVAAVRAHVAADVAQDIVAVLESDTRVTDRDGTEHAVGPGDLAVLVQRNVDGQTVRDALQSAGVPAVLTGTSSVFLSDAASDWLTLLTALEQPHRPGLTRAAALTRFVGWTPERLASDEAGIDRLAGTLREWADTLARRGVAALLETVTSTTGFAERLLRRADGERELTDVRHIGQILHAEAGRGEVGVSALVEWLRGRIREARIDVTEERSRRLESDANAVQVVTVHRAKGLEFPIVYAPYLWDRFVAKTPDPLRLHDGGARVLDVGGSDDPGYAERRKAHAEEDAGESLRLAYVALTRARAQVVAYWAPTKNTETAPLHRMLFASRGIDGSLPQWVAVPADSAVRAHLMSLSERAAGTIAVEVATGEGDRAWQPPSDAPPPLAVREFDRTVDSNWARMSYSRLTAGLHEFDDGATSEAEDPGTVDEPVVEVASDATRGPVSPMAELPVGAAFGTHVHGVLEELDFADTDLRTRIIDLSADSGRAVGVEPAALADAMLPSLSTPLGPLASGLRLVDVPRGGRLDELDFELPLAGGDTSTADASVASIAGLLREHLPADDPLAAYAGDLAAPQLAARRLRGFLTGSIDLVLRVGAAEGAPCYLVVDYKTNWIGTDETLTAWHYRPDALAGAMRAAHYPLQALLYSVALHRFLRWRQPAYDPDTHLGGVLYLFLRGMCGPETPVVDGVPCGVFSWRPPASLVVGLSDLLDRGAG
ncbi:UvrD-helicase domain-containing protein [Solicola gregarius]|uniref:RecBCD enzyme subunit RecB n=1 Tax=Solicola gregarius TaxID=2908642 RepID=A0AA46YLA5_9ACTN|nr:UvrD-helicase domain-containing protein [Solicola gregarius]UYM04678.1 UvrD-helicase domain-containing protein [Solicola gregarius]